jgi:hypothetical protein
MDIMGALRNAAEQPRAAVAEPNLDQPNPDNDVEIILLAAAGAIQRLIAERNSLRIRTEAQERELMHFRRQGTLIHDTYRRLTSEFISQFQLIDNAVDNFVHGPTKPD